MHRELLDRFFRENNAVGDTPSAPALAKAPYKVFFHHTHNAYISVRSVVFESLVCRWSGRRESNPQPQLGKLLFCH